MNTKLLNRSYQDDTDYTDEWEIIGSKELSLLALPYFVENLDFLEDIEKCMRKAGYVDAYDNLDTVNDGMGAGEVLGRIALSEICLVRSHGGMFWINTSPDNYLLQRVAINDLEEGYFTNTKLLILECCGTGSGGETANNMVNAFHNKGVPTVIGFERSVHNIEANFWCLLFFEALSGGKTAREAGDYAAATLPRIWEEYCLNPDNDPNNTGLEKYAYTISTSPYLLVGDKSATFNKE